MADSFDFSLGAAPLTAHIRAASTEASQATFRPSGGNVAAATSNLYRPPYSEQKLRAPDATNLHEIPSHDVLYSTTGATGRVKLNSNAQLETLQTELRAAQEGIAKRDAAIARGRAAYNETRVQLSIALESERQLKENRDRAVEAQAEAERRLQFVLMQEIAVAHRQEEVATDSTSATIAGGQDADALRSARYELVVLRRTMATSVLSRLIRNLATSRVQSALRTWHAQCKLANVFEPQLNALAQRNGFLEEQLSLAKEESSKLLISVGAAESELAIVRQELSVSAAKLAEQSIELGNAAAKSSGFAERNAFLEDQLSLAKEESSQFLISVGAAESELATVRQELSVSAAKLVEQDVNLDDAAARLSALAERNAFLEEQAMQAHESETCNTALHAAEDELVEVKRELSKCSEELSRQRTVPAMQTFLPGEGPSAAKDLMKQKMIQVEVDLSLRSAEVTRLTKQCADLSAMSLILQQENEGLRNSIASAPVLVVKPGEAFEDAAFSFGIPVEAGNSVSLDDKGSSSSGAYSPRRRSSSAYHAVQSPASLLIQAEASSLRCALEQAALDLDNYKAEVSQLRDALEFSHQSVSVHESVANEFDTISVELRLQTERADIAERECSDTRHQFIALRRKIAAAGIARWSSRVANGSVASAWRLWCVLDARAKAEQSDASCASSIAKLESVQVEAQQQLATLLATSDDARIDLQRENTELKQVVGEQGEQLATSTNELAELRRTLELQCVKIEQYQASLADAARLKLMRDDERAVTESEWIEAASRADDAVSSALALRTEAESVIREMAVRLAQAQDAAVAARHSADKDRDALSAIRESAQADVSAAQAAQHSAEANLSAAMAEADKSRAAIAALRAAEASGEARMLAFPASLETSMQAQSPSGLGRFPVSTAVIEAIRHQDAMGAEVDALSIVLAQFRRHIRKAAGTTTMSTSLRFSLDFASLGSEGSEQRELFADAIRTDLASVLNVQSSRICITRFSAGSIVTELSVVPATGDSMEETECPLEIACRLEALFEDTNDNAFTGPASRHIDRSQKLQIVYDAPRERFNGQHEATDFYALQFEYEQQCHQLAAISLQLGSAHEAVLQLGSEKHDLETQLQDSADRAAELELGSGFALAKAHAEIDSLTRQLQDATENCSSLSLELDKTHEQLQSTCASAIDSEKHMAEAHLEALAAAEASINNAEARFVDELYAAQQKADADAASLSQLQELVSKRAEDVDKLTAQRDSARDIAGVTSQRYSELRVVAERLRVAIESSKVVETLEIKASLVALQVVLRNVPEAIPEIPNDRLWVKATTCGTPQEAAARIADLSAAVEALSAEIEQLLSQPSTLQHNSGEVDSGLLALAVELNSARSDILAAEEVHNQDVATISLVKGELQQLQVRFEVLHVEAESLRVANGTLLAELPTLRREFEALEAHNSALREANGELQGALHQTHLALKNAGTSLTHSAGTSGQDSSFEMLRADRNALLANLTECQAELATAKGLIVAMEQANIRVKVGDSDVLAVPDARHTVFEDGMDASVMPPEHFGAQAALLASPAVRRSFSSLQNQLRRALAERDAVRAELSALVQAAVSAAIESPWTQKRTRSPSDIGIADKQMGNNLSTESCGVALSPAAMASSVRALRGRISQLEHALQASVLREVVSPTGVMLGTAEQTLGLSRSSPAHQEAKLSRDMTDRDEGKEPTASGRPSSAGNNVSQSSRRKELLGQSMGEGTMRVVVRPMPDARSMVNSILSRGNLKGRGAQR